MSTFLEMAERWIRENRPAVEESHPVPTVPADDPAPWGDHFSCWLAEHCTSREGRVDASAIGCLHVDFCRWAVEHKGVPCVRENFETLLRDAGFRLRDGMASGLVLRTDLAAYRDFAEHTARRRA